ncbi:unnamed protein product [Closterium sp. NIES-65]|nr:unnamed protein product [Closterium sp. NIES-65]
MAEPPSRPAAEPPSRQAAEPPSRPAAKPPSRRAAQQPSRRAAKPPNRRATKPLPSSRYCHCQAAATALTALFLPACPGPTHSDCLYYIVTRLPDSLRLVRDHFLSVGPTTLTVDLLEERLLAAEKSIVPLGASRGQGGQGRMEGLAGAVEVAVEAVEGVGVVVGVVAGVEVTVAALEAEEAAAVALGAEAAEVAETAAAAVELAAALRRGVVPVVVRASSSSALVRPRPPRSFVSGTLGVREVGVLVRAPTCSVPATALVSSEGARTPPSAASAA